MAKKNNVWRYALEVDYQNRFSVLVRIVDRRRDETVSMWQGATALCLLSHACVPLRLRQPGLHECDKWMVCHLLCTGTALERSLKGMREADVSASMQRSLIE